MIILLFSYWILENENKNKILLVKLADSGMNVKFHKVGIKSNTKSLNENSPPCFNPTVSQNSNLVTIYN